MPDSAAKKGNGQVVFGSVVRLCTARSKDPAADGLDRYIGLDHLDPSDLRIRRWGRVEDGTTFTNRFASGQVLFGKRRAYQRKVGVAEFEGVCSGDIYVFESKDPAVFLPGLLPFVCQTESFFEYAVGTSAGSLSPRTNWKHLVKYEFALPEPAEQARTLAALQAVESNLRGAQDLLGATIEARESLTQWYATAGGQPLSNVGTVIRDRLPEGWTLNSIRELCTGDEAGLTLGPFGSSLTVKDYGHLDTGTPVLFVADVRRYALRHASQRFISKEKHEDLKAHEAIGGDVLVTEMGWPPGEACVVPEGWPPSIVKADIIRARLNRKRMLPEYLTAVLNSHWGQQQLVRISPGTTRPRMTLRDFEAIKIATPPVDAQCEAVAEVEHYHDAIASARGRVTGTRELKSGLMAELLEG